MARLDNRVALVTGAGRYRGIGRATALHLAELGADVVVSAAPRDPATYPEEEKQRGWRGADSVVEEIEALGRRAVAVTCDVTERAQVDAMFEVAARELGTPDAIVNNAGTAGGAGGPSLLDLDDAVWDRTIAINLNGPFYVSRAAGRGMRKAGRGGAIVNLSSLAGRMGYANFGGYCASKFGVIGLTQQLALELSRYGIRVNCVCPGFTDTDMADGTMGRLAERSSQVSFEQLKNQSAKAVPLRRFGRPSELAATIGFLLGEGASYTTGQTINVDGGVRMD